MHVRSVASLTIALALLASSAVLGLMVHDAEVGGPEAAGLQNGDVVRLRGEASGLAGDEAPVPLEGPAIALASDDWQGLVIVVGDELPQHDTWVVQGEVLGLMPLAEGSLLLLRALEVTEPILFS